MLGQGGSGAVLLVERSAGGRGALKRHAAATPPDERLRELRNRRLRLRRARRRSTATPC
jgi:hypothetical protein